MGRTDLTFGRNLPAELSSFVGRRHELDEVRQLLGQSRLVTLTGVGGVGKTRLAQRVAREVRRAFPDGVWFVDLTRLRAPELLVLNVEDPDVLAYLVLVALGLRDRPGGPSYTDQMVEQVRDRRVLLVLDNCEHLLPMGAALLVDALLQGCPELRILATSREPCLVSGEVIFRVPPLQAPRAGERVDPAGLERIEAVTLFVDRAQAVMHDFALREENAAAVAELCRRLDGLPLALELAAARVRALTPGQILDRLAERFDLLNRGGMVAPVRQQTLRACVDWSFDLCGKPERLLWARLAVFAAGCELDTVEGICTDGHLPAEDLLEVVAGLVDKSVLVRDDQGGGTARYRMFETLRDYGQENLESWGEYFELGRRHRDWYTQLALRFEADVISPRQADWLARLDRELPNIRAALRYSLADPDGAEAALTLAADLYLYWLIRGLQGEGHVWLEQALARSTRPSLSRVKASSASATMASLQGDLHTARKRVRQGYETAAELGDTRAHGIVACAEAALAMARGELTDAARAWQSAVDTLGAEGAEEYLNWRLNAFAGLAMTKGMLGQVEAVAGCHEAILAICQPRRESWFYGMSLLHYGQGLRTRGDLEAAAARLREGLQHLRHVHDTLGTAWCLDALAWIAGDEGRQERAATLLGAVTQLWHAMGARAAVFPQLSAFHEQYEREARAALGEHAYQAAFACGGRMSLDEATAYALDQPWQPAAPAPSEAATPLTRRERQVADLIAQGLSNKEIATRLVIAQRTAEGHVENILTKLGLTNRAQVAAWMAARSPATARDAGSAG